MVNQGVNQQGVFTPLRPGMIPSPDMEYPPPPAPPFNQQQDKNSSDMNPMWIGTSLDKKLSMIKIGDFNGSDDD